MFDRSRPHRRYNPLTGEWVLVSPQRTARPWQGQHEQVSSEAPPAYDPQCYLCPGNERVGGARNPRYRGTFVFDNDFPALVSDTTPASSGDNGLIVAQGEPGVCRVVCFSPRHDLTLAEMSLSEGRQVVDAWITQYVELGAMPLINWIQIFENRGAMMGASNPHPHCQVWATLTAPNELAKENAAQLDHQNRRGRCLLCDYLSLESRLSERLVCANEHFLALVPFWAVWPFEIMILSKRHAAALDELSDEERNQLADILKQVTNRYDNLFQTSFPYSMGFHQRPADNTGHSEWHLHAHFYPPLLSSATVRKFMVGYELLASPQRDIQPEEAAARLRSCLVG
jgi:UDPglucose--hexose-1-phosphate uridylyltransferase